MISRFFIISIFVFLSNSFSRGKKNDKSFFDFDKVVHYHKEIKDSELRSMFENANEKGKDSEESLYTDIVSGFYPEQIDINIGRELINFGFNSVVINQKKNSQFNKIFSERKCDSYYAYACVPVYRDILLFYKNDSLVGITKICFGCKQAHIVGAKNIIEDFGQCGVYEKLQVLLSK
jgi:hypothetical protein